MNSQDFDKVFEETVRACREILCGKGEEYSRYGDRLWNFKSAAALQNCSPEKALWGMLAKHIVSLQDITDHPEEVAPETFYEKSQDAINYLILLTGLMKERWMKGKTRVVAQVDIPPRSVEECRKCCAIMVPVFYTGDREDSPSAYTCPNCGAGYVPDKH